MIGISAPPSSCILRSNTNSWIWFALWGQRWQVGLNMFTIKAMVSVYHFSRVPPPCLSRRSQRDGSAQIWTLKSARAIGNSLDVSTVRKKMFSGENGVLVFQAIKRRSFSSRTVVETDAFWRYHFWKGEPPAGQRSWPSESWKTSSTIVLITSQDISSSMRRESLIVVGVMFIVQGRKVCCLVTAAITKSGCIPIVSDLDLDRWPFPLWAMRWRALQENWGSSA